MSKSNRERRIDWLERRYERRRKRNPVARDLNENQRGHVHRSRKQELIEQELDREIEDYWNE